MKNLDSQTVNNLMKFFAGAGLFAAWGFFAYIGKTDVNSFVQAIGFTISGLGVYHVSGTPKQPPDAPMPQSASITVTNSTN